MTAGQRNVTKAMLALSAVNFALFFATLWLFEMVSGYGTPECWMP